MWFVRLWPTDRPLTEAGPLRTTLATRYRQAGLWEISKGTVVLYERR